MNVTLNTQLLAQELRLVNKIVPTKPALPILLNVLLRATGDKLYFYGTDLEVGFTTNCPALVSLPGVITLPAKRLLDMIEQLPSADVQLSLDKNHVYLTCGAFRSRLQTFNAADFPMPPIVEGTPYWLSTMTFHTLIKRTRYAIAERSQKFLIDGALLSITSALAAIVATDGKRLSLSTMPRAVESDAPLSVVIPAKTLDALLAQDIAEDIQLSQSDRHLFFVAGERTLISRVIEGKFPAYHRIIPKENNYVATIDKVALAASIRRVGLVSDDNQSAIFTFSENSVTLTSSSAEIGDAHEQLTIAYTGPTLKISINWQYVLDFLNTASGHTVSVALKDANTPLLLTDSTDFLNVVMLLRS